MLKKIFKAGLFLIFPGLLSVVMQCNPGEANRHGNTPGHDPLQPKPAITTTVAGIVIDETGKPVPEADVNIHGEAALTDVTGSFVMTNIQVPGNRCVIQTKKSGFFAGTKAVTPEENGRSDARIVLMASPVTHTFESTAGLVASLPDGSEVRIPADGLADASGNQYLGLVNLSVRRMDPMAGNFGAVVPGGDLLALRKDQSTSVLNSYGIFRVQMTSLSGESLQLSPGATSTLLMNIPHGQLDTAPEKIPLWHFDEDKGVWREKGFAIRDGSKYVGTVSQITDWNFVKYADVGASMWGTSSGDSLVQDMNTEFAATKL